MEEEKEPRTGRLPRDEETAVMVIDATKMDPPAKLPPLKLRKLRNLAILSVVCGCSCIGVLALIYAVKANEKQKAGSQDSAIYWAKKSRCKSFLSIGVWWCLLVMVPLSLILISYIVSQIE